jgi:hypothetical protein
LSWVGRQQHLHVSDESADDSQQFRVLGPE